MNDSVPVHNWERYIYPPIDGNIYLGDILVKNVSNPTENDYRLILSPSCDLVKNRNVNNVLVAQCTQINTMISKLGLGDAGPRKYDESLPERVLNQGFCNSLIPLPKLENVVPNLVADLKMLELIPYDLIFVKREDAPEISFFRIVSMVSPFREMVSWAYMQTAGRIGLPDRIHNQWCESIYNEIQDGKKAKSN